MDFFVSYPPQETKNIQAIISSKKEFQELSGERISKLYYNHQLFVQRFMMFYDYLLLIHEPGTGKSCAAIAAAEYFKQNPGRIRRAIILVKGPTLIDEWKKQIVCFCTGGRYMLNKNESEGLTRREINHKVHKRINEFYKIYTYITFVSQVMTMKKDDVERKYKNVLFIIDEVHNLRNMELSEAYSMIYDISHQDGNKRLLMTATPMINETSEMITILNLLNPSDMKITSNSITKKIVERYANGNVSYIKSANSNVNIVYKGVELNHFSDNKTLVSICYPLAMSDFQSEIYFKLWDQKKRDIHQAEDSASLFVFPQTTKEEYGGNQYNFFDVYINTHPNGTYSLKDSMKKALSTHGLERFSVKYAEILKILKIAKANVFCFNSLVNGGGIILLSLCLEFFGYEIYDGSYELIKTDEEANLFCIRSTEEKQTIVSKKAKRISYITGSVDDTRRKNIMNAFNHRENRHGEYIKLLIASDVLRDGINLSNVLDVILLTLEWHEAGNFQAIFRAIRSTSHEDLIKEYGSIDVNVYKFMAFPVLYGVNRYDISIDRLKLEINENKDLQNKEIMRVLKTNAVDCNIFHERNNDPLDPYECKEKPLPFDDTTFDLYFSHNIVYDIKRRILKIIFERSYISLNDIKNLLYPAKDIYIFMAIHELIKQQVSNRFGKVFFLCFKNGMLFLSPDEKSETQDIRYYTENLIVQDVISLNDHIKNNIVKIQDEMMKKIYKTNTDDEFTSIFNKMNIISKTVLLENAITNLFSKHSNDKTDLKIFNMFYNRYLYGLYEDDIKSLTELAKTIIDKKIKGCGRKGRKGPIIKAGVDVKMNEDADLPSVTEVLSKDNMAKIVFCHDFSGENLKTIGYSRLSNYVYSKSPIRILDLKSSKTWRNPLDFEIPAYQTFIRNIRMEIENHYTKMGTFGVFFDLYNEEDQNSFIIKNENISYINVGKKCETITLLQQIDLIFKLKIPITPLKDDMDNPLNRDTLNKLSIAETNKNLAIVNSIYKNKLNRCKVIMNHLRNENRLWII